MSACVFVFHIIYTPNAIACSSVHHIFGFWLARNQIKKTQDKGKKRKIYKKRKKVSHRNITFIIINEYKKFSTSELQNSVRTERGKDIWISYAIWKVKDYSLSWVNDFAFQISQFFYKSHIHKHSVSNCLDKLW